MNILTGNIVIKEAGPTPRVTAVPTARHAHPPRKLPLQQ